MNFKRRVLLAILIMIAFILVAFIIIIQTLPPPPLPSTIPLDQFSSERAIKHIQVIANQPHPTGSAANRLVREYIFQELKYLGLETEFQPDGSLVNVVGRIKGTNSNDAVLLTAHFDSVAKSSGAVDDGSGVAVLLETARALKSGKPMRNTVIFLFTDNEEGGLLGANAFIASHSWAKNVRFGPWF